jgi:hypothetical protein
MNVHDGRGDLRKGEEERRNPADICSFSNKIGCCLYLKKYKKWVKHKSLPKNDDAGIVANEKQAKAVKV